MYGERVPFVGNKGNSKGVPFLSKKVTLTAPPPIP